MLDKLIFLLALAGTAVVFADVLVRPGMLLEPVQRALRTTWTYYQIRAQLRLSVKLGKALPDIPTSQLDEQWWWPPLWGCYKCVAGQWGFWGYLFYVCRHMPAASDFRPDIFRTWAAHAFGCIGQFWLAYSLPEHLAFTAFTIIAAIIISKWTQE
jgi:hypothetical protein